MIEKTSSFKSVIFFGVTDKRSLAYKETLSKITLVKVFLISSLDEMQQIIDMSEKTVILTDNNEALEFLIKFSFDKKKPSRRYHLDWEGKLALKDSSALSVNKISVIKASESGAIDEKIELYLFGRVKIFELGVFVASNNQVSEIKAQNFFTYLACSEAKWKIVVSSHEKEDNISSILGKNWEEFIDKLTSQAKSITGPVEDEVGDKSYYEIVYPYYFQGEIKKMCVIHFKVDGNFQFNKQKILNFLSSIPSQ